jgi:hypothetical protein
MINLLENREQQGTAGTGKGCNFGFYEGRT